MFSNLSAVPTGTNILIDTNIFGYGLAGKSSQCKDLLRRCSTEDVFGISLFEVVHEATHDFMRAEAKAKNMYTSAEKGAKYLAKHPEKVKALVDYWSNTKRLLSLNVVFLPMEESIVVGAQAERASNGLLTNDSIIVAAMREYGISLLATNDRQFDAVAGISVFSPTDI